jgi:hypothetical protein
MKRERWLLLISILIFSGLGVYYLRPGWLGYFAMKKSTGAPAKPQPIPAEVSGRGSEGIAEARVTGELIDQSASWGRNPFLTESEAARGKAREFDGLTVKAIIIGRPKSVAMIDGRTVAVGEKIGDERVVEIRKDSVVLEMDGIKRILRLSEPSIPIEVRDRKAP